MGGPGNVICSLQAPRRSRTTRGCGAWVAGLPAAALCLFGGPSAEMKSRRLGEQSSQAPFVLKPKGRRRTPAPAETVLTLLSEAAGLTGRHSQGAGLQAREPPARPGPGRLHGPTSGQAESLGCRQARSRVRGRIVLPHVSRARASPVLLAGVPEAPGLPPSPEPSLQPEQRLWAAGGALTAGGPEMFPQAGRSSPPAAPSAVLSLACGQGRVGRVRRTRPPGSRLPREGALRTIWRPRPRAAALRKNLVCFKDSTWGPEAAPPPRPERVPGANPLNPVPPPLGAGLRRFSSGSPATCSRETVGRGLPSLSRGPGEGPPRAPPSRHGDKARQGRQRGKRKCLKPARRPRPGNPLQPEKFILK